MSDTQQHFQLTDPKPESDTFAPLLGDDDTPKERAPKPPSTEKRPTPTLPRQPIAELAGMIWTGIGVILDQTQLDPPVGRAMQFQAPIAGNTIDELIKGTWLDEILQPFVARIGAVEGIGSLIALPLLVGVYERNPGLSFAVEPLLIQSLQSQLAELAPTLKKQKSKQREAVKAMADANEALGLDKDADPLVAMLQHIFGGPAPTEPMPTEPEPGEEP